MQRHFQHGFEQKSAENLTVTEINATFAEETLHARIRRPDIYAIHYGRPAGDPPHHRREADGCFG